MIYEKEIDELSEYQKNLASARFVQQGLLPKERHFKRLFEDSFALYIPQNIISGDFYWVGQRHEMRYVVVGDCTGHGISASLLSVLALNLLEYSIMNKGIKKTNKILQEMDKKFIESFKDSEKVNFDNPWIDLSIVCIDDKKNKLYFSSANRKLLMVRKNGETEIHRGSSYPIGGWQIEKERKFQCKSFDYEEGDLIYLGSDGFQDQMGGNKGKKYTSKRLHRFLEENSEYSCRLQKEKLAVEYMMWKGENFQVDDICIVGVRL